MERRRACGRWLGWGIPLLLLLAFLLYLSWARYCPTRITAPCLRKFEAAAEAAVYTAESPGGETVRYISDNREAMALRLAMAEAAEEEIILSTFDFDADEPGCQLLSALLHAAERGVQVKVLVDGVSGWMDVYASPWFQALAAHPNAEVKIYNPITSLEPWRDMYRLHDKYFIVDGEMYLLGGRNSTDLFLGEGYPGQNLDSEVLVRRNEPRAGDSTEQLLSYFESIWALDECQTVAVTHPAAAEKEARAAERPLQPPAPELPGGLRAGLAGGPGDAGDQPDHPALQSHRSGEQGPGAVGGHDGPAERRGRHSGLHAVCHSQRRDDVRSVHRGGGQRILHHDPE